MISSPFLFLREILIYLCLSALLICLVEWSAGLNPVTLDFFQASYREVGVTALLMISLLVLLDTLSRRRYVSILPLAVPLILIALVSRQKLDYLSEPLYPWDFIFAKQIYNLLPELAGEKLKQVIISTICGLALFYITFRLTTLIYRRQQGNPPGRTMLAASLLIVATLAISVNTAPGIRWIRDTLKIQPLSWVQIENYKEKGFILAFSMNMKSALIERPHISGDVLVNELSKTLPSSLESGTADSEQHPDIIIIMSEAFWDPSRLPEAHLSIDPMPTIRALSGGDLFSPSQGGYTSNVEFEFLTGFSNAFLPDGSVPYQHYLRRNTPSFIWTLKSQGYEAIAIHPYYKKFWNRDSVYQYLGFDHFLALEDMSGLTTKGPFVSDRALFERVHETLEAATKPAVLFAVTMQNHGPYEKGRYGQPTVPIQFDTRIDEQDAIQTFSQGILETDNALSLLIERLSKRSRPSLLVFFGDHTPYLGKNLSAYRQAGLISDAPTEELSTKDYVSVHRTPLVIWSSIPEDQNAPIDELTSPSLLPSLLMKKLNIHHPFYSGILQDVRHAFPVVERRVLHTHNGQWIENWRDHHETLLQQYQAIQYDMMFGDQSSHSILFKDMPIQ